VAASRLLTIVECWLPRESIMNPSPQASMYRRLFLVVADTVATHTNLPLPFSAVVRILTLLVENGEEEIRMLESMHEDVKALVEAPYRTGLIWIEDAAKPHRSDVERRACLMEARSRFMDAYGQERQPLRKALIEYRLGLCWLLLESRHDARDWLQRAYRSADEVLQLLEAEWTRRPRNAFENIFEEVGLAVLALLGRVTRASQSSARLDKEPQLSPDILQRGSPAIDLMESIEHLASRAPGLGLRL
jgi:hypothetical protein